MLGAARPVRGSQAALGVNLPLEPVGEERLSGCGGMGREVGYLGVEGMRG